MHPAKPTPRDPLGWCIALALAFWALLLVRLTIPTKPYFDEVHYLPAAREYWALGKFINREHPLLGKVLQVWCWNCVAVRLDVAARVMGVDVEDVWFLV